MRGISTFIIVVQVGGKPGGLYAAGRDSASFLQGVVLLTPGSGGQSCSRSGPPSCSAPRCTTAGTLDVRGAADRGKFHAARLDAHCADVSDVWGVLHVIVPQIGTPPFAALIEHVSGGLHSARLDVHPSGALDVPSAEVLDVHRTAGLEDLHAARLNVHRQTLSTSIVLTSVMSIVLQVWTPFMQSISTSIVQMLATF